MFRKTEKERENSFSTTFPLYYFSRFSLYKLTVFVILYSRDIQWGLKNFTAVEVAHDSDLKHEENRFSSIYLRVRFNARSNGSRIINAPLSDVSQNEIETSFLAPSGRNLSIFQVRAPTSDVSPIRALPGIEGGRKWPNKRKKTAIEPSRKRRTRAIPSN